MPAVTRSKKHGANDVDELSGLMTSMKITPKSKSRHRTPYFKKEKDISDLFSGLALSKKSRRHHKGVRFTHKKTHKTPRTASASASISEYEDVNMMLGGKRKNKRRRTMRRH